MNIAGVAGGAFAGLAAGAQYGHGAGTVAGAAAGFLGGGPVGAAIGAGAGFIGDVAHQFNNEPGSVADFLVGGGGRSHEAANGAGVAMAMQAALMKLAGGRSVV